MHDSSLPLLCRWDIRSSGMLRSVDWWLGAYVSRKPVSPIFKDRAVPQTTWCSGSVRLQSALQRRISYDSIQTEMLSVVGIIWNVEGRCLGKLQSVVKYELGAHIALTKQTTQQHMKSYFTESAVARRNNSSLFFDYCPMYTPIPVVARSKAWVYVPVPCWGCGFEFRQQQGCLFWGLCFVRQRSLRRTDHSSRRVLPTLCVCVCVCVCLSVIVKPR
jgi:hypothetical protein